MTAVLTVALSGSCLEGGHRLGTLGDDTVGASDTLVPGDTVAHDTSVATDGSVLPDTLPVNDTSIAVDTRVGIDATDASGQPCLAVAPASVNFGTVQVGSSVERDVAVTNCGAGAVGPVTVELDSALQSFEIVGTRQVATLPAGASWPVRVRFAPVVSEANVGCRAADVQPSTVHLLARAATTARNTLSGAGTAPVDGGSCMGVLTFAPDGPTVAGEPFTVRWNGNTGLCLDRVNFQGQGTEYDGYGGEFQGPAGGTGREFVPVDAGLYAFSGEAFTSGPVVWDACPRVFGEHEVQPQAGFVVKLRWTHAGVTGTDPLGDARLALHIARLAGPNDPPAWNSSLWDTWPDWSPQRFESAEAFTWPSAATSAYGRVEFAQTGDRYEIGVAAETWVASPGTAHPVAVTVTLELWVRGTLVHITDRTVTPGALVDLLGVSWRPPSGETFTLSYGPDHE